MRIAEILAKMVMRGDRRKIHIELTQKGEDIVRSVFGIKKATTHLPA